MKRNKIYAFVFVVALSIFTFALAYAWPDQAPTKATISGPGLDGVVTIADKNVLDALKMGGLEDLTSVGISAPNVSNGYTIQRWFDNGAFRFADLTYYPGNPSYVYFQDGPQLQGDHTAYNNRWLKTTAHGDAVMKEFLKNANATKNENIVMRANDTMLGYDAATTQPRFVLPNGVRSADGTAYYAAFPSADTTAVHRFNLDDGSIAQTFALKGAWNLSRVSANGKWLVFAPAANFDTTGFKSSKSEFVIVNAESGQVTRTVLLDGKFDADGIDAFGRSLYLIQHLSDQYQVRLYDVVAGQLQDGVLVDKREADEKMIGYPWDAVAVPQNDWLVTLYINTEKKNAFIHALNLRDQYTFCIDLPPGNSEEALLKHYVLALAPDEKTLYAIDPELGVLSLVDFQNGNVTRTIRFPIATPVSNNAAAAAAADGKFVYFSNGGRVWQFDVSAGQVKQILQSDKLIVALNVRANDNALYLVFADHTMQKLNQQPARKN